MANSANNCAIEMELDSVDGGEDGEYNGTGCVKISIILQSTVSLGTVLFDSVLYGS